jgi:DMSO/TMAO reductase YedYZ molybdopterin-dependent catalytic subunit
MNDSLRTGPERIPPGQYVTDKWPVLTYGPVPTFDPETWRFTVSGLVAREVSWSWRELKALPRFEVTADFHCVTRFSTLDNGWGGVATREVIRHVTVGPEASHVLVHCHGGYTTNLPLEDFLSERSLFADTWNGKPLAVEHGGPLRLVVPHLYAWKSAKWVSGIELLAADRRGFWEENGYHTYGDPWEEERFSSQETKNAGQVRKRARELGLRLDGAPAGSAAQ